MKKNVQVDRRILLIIFDVLIIQLACYLSIYLRFDFHFADVPTEFWEGILKYSLINIICTLVLETVS